MEKDLTERIVLGIDPGTGRCGYAVLGLKVAAEKSKNKKIEILGCGLIETPVGTSLSERLGLIYAKVDEVIRKFKVSEMATEELFFVKNVKTGISVAHARGVVMLAGQKHKLPIFEYKPNEVKLAIAGFGHATKPQMQRMLKLHLKDCTVKQDDTVDAIAIALMHLNQNQRLRG